MLRGAISLLFACALMGQYYPPPGGGGGTTCSPTVTANCNPITNSSGNLPIGTGSGISFTTTGAPPDTLSGALAGMGAGSLSNGDYFYAMQCGTAGNHGKGIFSNTITVTDATANGKILLNVPICPDGNARSLYRSDANFNAADYEFLVTISNTAPTYIDNIPDASLGAFISNSDTSGGYMYKNSALMFAYTNDGNPQFFMPLSVKTTVTADGSVGFNSEMKSSASGLTDLIGSDLSSTITGSATVTHQYGSLISAAAENASHSHELMGVVSSYNVIGSSTVDYAWGLRAVQNINGGSVSNAMGVGIDATANNGVTPTNLYGLLIGDQNIGTNNWAIKTGAGKIEFGQGGSANKAICWKSDGKTLGYCSTIIGADGSCTCN